jgi:hypothetical protein
MVPQKAVVILYFRFLLGLASCCCMHFSCPPCRATIITMPWRRMETWKFKPHLNLLRVVEVLSVGLLGWWNRTQRREHQWPERDTGPVSACMPFPRLREWGRALGYQRSTANGRIHTGSSHTIAAPGTPNIPCAPFCQTGPPTCCIPCRFPVCSLATESWTIVRSDEFVLPVFGQ